MSMNNIFPIHVMEGRKPRKEKPLILGCDKYQSILNHLNEDANDMVEEEKRYNEYLRDTSKEMISKWTNYVHDITAKEIADRKKLIDDKIAAHQSEYVKIKDNDEKIRLEKIARAEALIEKLKPGARDLRSAFMQSECLQSNIALKKIRDDYYKLVREKEDEFDKNYLSNDLPFLEADRKRAIESKKNLEKYRKEIQQIIQENDKRRKDCKKLCMDLAKCERENLIKKNLAEEEKQRQLAIKRKKDSLKNVTEGLEYEKQRKLREKCEDEIDCKISGLTLKSQQTISSMTKSQNCKAKKVMEAEMSANYERLKKVMETNCTLKKDQAQYEKDAIRNNNRLIDAEQEIINKINKTKLERIKQNEDEMNRDRGKMDQKTEEYRFDIANRLKNLEINKEHTKMRENIRRKKVEETRKTLDYQVKEKQRVLKEEEEYERRCSGVDHTKEDNFFLSYANKFLVNATAKKRNTYPIEQAIFNYKKERYILDTKKPETATQSKPSTDRKDNTHLDQNCQPNLLSSTLNTCCQSELNSLL